MKYIRTKDGIYETITESLYKNDDLLYIDGYQLERIIEQADTIEELCDEFVIDGIYGHQVIHSYKELKEVEFECIRQGNYVEIYGAIWTDKGLIYVAKMNEKGELELL